MAKGGALLRRWVETPAWVRIPPPPFPSGKGRDSTARGGRLDGWPSGLRRTIGNRVGASPRGFESHPVREWIRSGSMEPGLRGVAQSGRALRSGRRGPRFESGRPDLGGVVLTGKAPHSKCGARKRMGVRVPPPPLYRFRNMFYRILLRQ